MKQIGKFNGIPVMSSPFVEKNSIYLINREALDVWKIKGIRPLAWHERIKRYFKNLWKALRGKIDD